MKHFILTILCLQLLPLGAACAQERADNLRLRTLRTKLQSVEQADQPNRTTFWRAGRPQGADAEKVNPNATQPTDQPEVPQPSSEALAWFTEHASDPSLFTARDIASMSSAISAMSADEQRRWLDETVDVRSAMASDEWKTVSQWLDRYWQVQGFYDEDEVATFQQSMTTLTTDEVLLVMRHFADVYLARVNSRQMAQLRRQALLNAPPMILTSTRPSSVAPPARSPILNRRVSRRVIRDNPLVRLIKTSFVFRRYAFFLPGWRVR